MLGITHVGFNRTENRSEQIAQRKIYSYRLCNVHKHTGHTPQMMMWPNSVAQISWSEPVVVFHWYICRMSLAYMQKHKDTHKR